MAGTTDHKEVVKVLKEHVNRDYELQTGVESWRKLPEIPTAAEIMGALDLDGNIYDGDDEGIDGAEVKNTPSLPFNIVNGRWNSIGDYVGSHYQLLREDAVAPLREAVLQFKSEPMMKDTGSVAIYTHVYIIGITFSNLGPAPRIEFSHERAGKRIRWRQSKRLQQGTIVALTPAHDKFKNICKVAVVAARPLQGVEQNPPQVDLFWGDANEAEFDPTEEYIMIEARSGYFEASRHMLVAMQKLMTESFPLSEHLVSLDRLIRAPTFVDKQPVKNLNSLRAADTVEDQQFEDSQLQGEADNSLDNVDILGPWPNIGETSLDQSQIAAVRRILTKRLAIVQGPPGTGKTFVSISALEVMLDNLRASDPPIIVAAQTNHALDQLLNLIAPVEPNFLRLGGRTTEDNKVVKERTLYEVRNKTHNRGLGMSHYRNAKKALEASAEILQLDISKVINQGDDEVELLLALGIISQDQFDSLYDDEWTCAQDPELPPGAVALWLGREQWMVSPGCPAINMGFDEEEDSNFEELEEVEAETGKKDDDDIDALNGKWYPFKKTYTGRPSPGHSEKQLKRLLQSKKSLWDISPTIRGGVYRHMRRRLYSKMLEAFRSHLKDHKLNVQSVKIARWQSDASLIKTAGIKLIGCTTTGLSKYRGLLASLQPRTMLIEEAAETLEGTVLAAMFNSLEQLILVGDHQQLRAHCNISSLEKPPYSLSVSMFERLVNNGLEYTMLNKQRRMIPEIRELLNPFYPNLQDHHSVLDRASSRKPIPGMGGHDSYFFHHKWPESVDDAASRLNIYEAEMIAHFFTYLILNGVEPSEITVLTFYNGQRKVLLRELKKQPELALYGPFFNVFTVDSYQGEENDVILLSLVRSNDRHDIGFLENRNRAVVSLSRARRGLYVFGNSINLLAANAQSYQLWSSITDVFGRRGRLDIDSGLPIVCSNHQTESIVRGARDWEYHTGGCRKKCNGKLPCGHSCPYSCHPYSHQDILCKEPCRETLPCSHRCSERCGDSCRCICDMTSLPVTAMDEPRDGLWQLSLDDALGESSTRNSQTDQRPTPRQSISSGVAGSVSVGSSPHKWRQWDAAEADKALEKSHSAHRSTAANAATLEAPLFKEIHRAVTVDNGSRIRQVGGVTVRVLGLKTGVPIREAIPSPPQSDQCIEKTKEPDQHGSDQLNAINESRPPQMSKLAEFGLNTDISLLDVMNMANPSSALVKAQSPATVPSATPMAATFLSEGIIINNGQAGTLRSTSTVGSVADNLFNEDEDDLISFD